MCITRKAFCIKDDASSTASSSDSLSLSIHADHIQPTSSLHSNYSFSDSSSDILSQCGYTQLEPRQHQHHTLMLRSNSNPNSSSSQLTSSHSNYDISNNNDILSYSQLYSFINTFTSIFTKENYIEKQQQRIKLAVTTFILPMVVLKMNNFFDHLFCLLTLFVIRYAANKKWAEERSKNGKDSKGRNTHDENESDIMSTGNRVCVVSDGNMIEESPSSSTFSFTSTIHGKPPSYSDHCDDTSFIQDEDLLDTSFESDSSLSSSTCSSSLKPTSSFIPMDQDEATDEWGHFTDFTDLDQQQQLHNGGGVDSNNTPSMKNCSTLDDPFCSITKTMLRRRGHKLSVCRLEQLQEGEEEEEQDCY